MESLASTRSRRSNAGQKNLKLEKLEALKKLRKGYSDNKYDLIKDEKPVYEEVDEQEYANLVHQRREDEWIVDDNGQGYADDGREMFDSDSEYDEDDDNPKGSKSKKSHQPKVPVQPPKPKGNIKAMFRIAQEKEEKKKKRAAEREEEMLGRGKDLNNVQLEEDDILGDILSGINNDTASPSFSTPKPNKLIKRQVNSGSSRYASPNPFTKEPHSLRLGTPSSAKRKGPHREEEGDDLNFDQILKSPPKKKQVRSGFEPVVKEEPQFDEPVDDPMMDDDDFDESFAQGATESQGDDWEAPSNANSTITSSAAVLPSDLKMYQDSETPGKYFPFFWYDAHEDVKNPGTVYLFGKVFVDEQSKHYSCCIIVRNVERRVFLLPRKTFKDDLNRPVNTEIDIAKEFQTSLAKKYKITSFKSRRSKKKYAFSKIDVPDEAEYLEVLYPASGNIINSDESGQTFSHVLNTSQSSLERFLLECGLKGPSWLKIRNPEPSEPQISWCKFEFVINKAFAKNIVAGELVDRPVPTFNVISLSMKCCYNARDKRNEIVAISVLGNSEFDFENPPDTKKSTSAGIDSHFCLITKPSGMIFPFDFSDREFSKSNSFYKNRIKTKIFIKQSEKELLNLFMARISQIDPDIIIGHDIQNFDYDLLLNRLIHFKVPLWSRLGRLRRSGFPTITKKDRGLICGRLVCDAMISARELIHAKSYDLSQLVTEVLNMTRYPMFDKQEAIIAAYTPPGGKSAAPLLDLVMEMMKDNNYILRIIYDLNALPLAMQITKVAGNILSRTFCGGRSERNEYLLLHAFYEKNYICPEKFSKFGSNKNVTTSLPEPEPVVGDPDDEEAFEASMAVKSSDKNKAAQPGRKKAAYAGGLVLDPKIGFYDKFILLMDFNSLYPSIIQEFNICFTTINRASFANEDAIPDLPNPDLPPGILPTEIRKLVESRREVKKMLLEAKTTPEMKVQLNIKQLALKLTANSMYGCLGFGFARFYAKPLAALITYKGREILMATKMLVERMGLDVIYGDTDSIMINSQTTDYNEVTKIGRRVQAEVNAAYKLLEIGIDGVYKSMLLLKKKKYAALSASQKSGGKNSNELDLKRELKGLDIVRRDWSLLAKSAGERVIDLILYSEQTSDQVADKIHNFVKDLSEKLHRGEIPIGQFVITKQLTKNPDEYPDVKGLSHVRVALRYNENPSITRKLRAGDSIPYIICDDGSNDPATHRAYHLEEVKNSENLKPDIKYYLEQQIHPVIARLCDPLEGTNSQLLAEFMGLESASIRGNSAKECDPIAELNNELLRYDGCKSLELQCPNDSCKQIFGIRTLFRERDPNQPSKKPELSLEKCSYCNYSFINYQHYFKLQIKRIIEDLTRQYYQGWLVCNDTLCNFRTRNCLVPLEKQGFACPECRNGWLKEELTDKQMYTQLEFFDRILNFDVALKELQSRMDEVEQKLFKESYGPIYYAMKSVVEDYISKCAYNEVDLKSLFMTIKFQKDPFKSG